MKIQQTKPTKFITSILSLSLLFTKDLLNKYFVLFFCFFNKFTSNNSHLFLKHLFIQLLINEILVNILTTTWARISKLVHMRGCPSTKRRESTHACLAIPVSIPKW